MTKKEIALLLTPAVCFLVISFGLFASAGLLQMRLKADNPEKYAAFVENVKSGKWQPTSSEWIDLMQGQRTVIASDLKADISLREVLLTLVLPCLIGVIFQVGVILHFRKKQN